MATTAEELTTTTTPIVTLTPEAHRIVREALDQEPESASLALWLEVRGVQEGAFVYDLFFQATSDAAEADAVHADGDVEVVVPAGSVDRLRGARLEWSDEGDGGLVLVNPNTPTPEEASPGVPPEVLAAGITGPLALRVASVLEEAGGPTCSRSTPNRASRTCASRAGARVAPCRR
jgi:Fe-S cluster assembly iron-binding protein IscA